MPAQYVKAYVKRNKNDAADAEAICEAVQRPTMRFVAVKTAEQQAAQLLHRGREQLVRQRTMLVNALRAHLAEFGMVAAQGLRNVAQLIAIVRDASDLRLPDVARQVLQVLSAQLEHIEAAIAALEKQLMAWHKANAVSQRLASIPGIGPIIATAIATTVADPGVFRSGREFAAWLGLVPRQNSTGGKTRLGGITKRGNRYLRRLCSDDFFLKFYHRRVANGGVIDVLQSFYVAALLNLMRSEADAEMFWVGTEADGGYGMLDQHGQPKPVASLIVGILIALLIA